MNDTGWWEIFISIALIFLIMFGFNTCSAPKWNDGECPKCEVRYEMRDVSHGLKYYICPECGLEVERY